MPTIGIGWRRDCRFAAGRGFRTGGATTVRGTTPRPCGPAWRRCASSTTTTPWSALPLGISTARPMRGRVLRPLGSGEVCSDYLGILCHPAREEAVVESLADYLVENAFDDEPDAMRWDLLDLDGIDAEDRTMSALVDRLAASGCSVHRRAGMNCWRMELPTDWESYLASLGKNLRRDMRRLERNLLDTDRVVLHRVKRLDELPAGDGHSRRFAPAAAQDRWAKRAVLLPPGFWPSIRDVVPELLRHGQLQFYWLELDGKPVAAEFQLVGNGVLYEYQSGIDPAAMEHQPGKLINVAILRQAIAGGYRAFDFLRGDEPYKARLRRQAAAERRVSRRAPSPRRAASPQPLARGKQREAMGEERDQGSEIGVRDRGIRRRNHRQDLPYSIRITVHSAPEASIH